MIDYTDIYQLIGLSEEKAVEGANYLGWYNVRVNKPYYVNSCEYREDRLNLYLNDNGIVEEVSIG